jgi:peptidoglycan hydrolase CwlO-like protein
MGILDNTFSTLFGGQGRSNPGVVQKLERTLQRESALKRQLAQLQLRLSANAPDLDVKMDLLQFDVAQEKATVANLTAALLKAQEDLELEKANRSAAVHLLKKHGVVDGVAYASFTREQRVELVATAMDEVVGSETTSRWRARSPASVKSSSARESRGGSGSY